MNRIARNISIILRAERMIAQRHMLALRKQSGFLVAAGGVAAIGIVMLNVAAYHGLAETMSEAWAALTVAVVNLALAALLAYLAERASTSVDVEPVEEMRDMAIDDLEAEMAGIAEEARAVSEGIKRMASDPLGSLAPSAVGMLAKALVKHLKD